MTQLILETRGGRAAAVGEEALDALDASLRGAVIRPGEGGYDQARTLWNAMIDRHPGLVVRCAGPMDVVHAVSFAREHGLLISVRSGGHNIAGKALSDGALLIDLSPMRGVHVDPGRRVVRVEAGCTLGDLDRETLPLGLAVPVGINSTTGISGLTLGGGFGWLSRALGMTVDSLISADVVLASGELVTASSREHPDLFWGIRGGGGNLGIVTSWEFRLHPLGPDLLSGVVAYPFHEAREALTAYRAAANAAPDALSAWAVVRHAPPLPFIPEAWHGERVLLVPLVYAGRDQARGEKAIRPFRALGEPLGEHIAPQPFVSFQQAFDPLLTAGARNYWKSHNFRELSDELLDVVIEEGARLPTPQSEIFLAQMGGATNRVPPEATAYAHRDVEFIMNVHTRWEHPNQDAACVSWARGFAAAAGRYATGGVYVNFMPEDEEHRVPAAYGAGYERLARIKQSYDPGNLFRVNWNVKPA